MKTFLKLLFILLVFAALDGVALATGPSKQLGTIQPFDPPVDQNGHPITSLDAPVYNSFCAPKPNAVTLPTGGPVLLGQWENVRGTVTMECVDGGTKVNVHVTGLIPGGVYSAWVILFGPGPAKPDGSNFIADGALGMPDGSQNHFVASPGGEGSLSVLHPPGPLSNQGGGYTVSSCLLTEPNVGEVILGLAYHIDGHTHGGHPGASADDGCSFALPIAFTDYTPDAPTPLLNMSTRGSVGTGENVLIGGFIIGGDGAGSRVLVRAIGPSLSGKGISGALKDPLLELHDKNGAVIASNDSWKSSQKAEIEATTIAPKDDREAAILSTLAPGSYTAVVRGSAGTTGVALVEVYHLQ